MTTHTQPPIVSLSNVTKVYGSGDTRVTALDNVSVGFESGRFTALMGPSGSGKSTLLHMLAALDTPTSGNVEIAGASLATMNDNQRTTLRRDKIGFIFQAFNLVPTLDAAANIVLPLRLAGQQPDPAWMNQIIDSLGLRDRLTHLPSQLSGGQQQRVAVARALVSQPAVIVADEPTGNLDTASSAEVLGLLRSAVDDLGQSVIMVTHDQQAALVADRVLVLRDGRIVSDLERPSARTLAEAAQ
ncbi:MAG: ABC transporter ATP-binding protein [Actinomycetaceae bacterium]|nr:ABC transporter ATP-binding protein [Actinomycetaceae bacterium]